MVDSLIDLSLNSNFKWKGITRVSLGIHNENSSRNQIPRNLIPREKKMKIFVLQGRNSSILTSKA